jgi:hypothetical protein
MSFRALILLIFVALASVAAIATEDSPGQDPPQPSTSQLILLDGAAVAFRSLAVQDGNLSGDGVPADLTLDDLRRIELPDSDTEATVKPDVMVDLRGGGRVRAQNVTIANDKCRLEWTSGEPLSFPTDDVRAIRLDPATAHAEFEKALSTPSADLDRVFIKDDEGQVTGVTGLIDSLDSDQLKFQVSGQDHRVPRSRLYGVVIAQPAVAEKPSHCVVTFHDGSVLGGDSLSLSGDAATLSVPGSGKVEFSWKAAARIGIRSPRLAFLSDLKPIAEEQQPLVTLPLAAQRDKSVSGKPLTLGATVYEKGLGVHARSSLTFAADKKWDTLVATIGLDAAAGSKGDCVFVVAADGEPLLTRRMKGADSPAEISVPIAGRQQVTLQVEPGEGLDLADHADWCDVRFIKKAK